MKQTGSNKRLKQTADGKRPSSPGHRSPATGHSRPSKPTEDSSSSSSSDSDSDSSSSSASDQHKKRRHGSRQHLTPQAALSELARLRASCGGGWLAEILHHAEGQVLAHMLEDHRASGSKPSKRPSAHPPPRSFSVDLTTDADSEGEADKRVEPAQPDPAHRPVPSTAVKQPRKRSNCSSAQGGSKSKPGSKRETPCRWTSDAAALVQEEVDASLRFGRKLDIPALKRSLNLAYSEKQIQRKANSFVREIQPAQPDPGPAQQLQLAPPQAPHQHALQLQGMQQGMHPRMSQKMQVGQQGMQQENGIPGHQGSRQQGTQQGKSRPASTAQPPAASHLRAGSGTEVRVKPEPGLGSPGPSPSRSRAAGNGPSPSKARVVGNGIPGHSNRQVGMQQADQQGTQQADVQQDLRQGTQRGMQAGRTSGRQQDIQQGVQPESRQGLQGSMLHTLQQRQLVAANGAGSSQAQAKRDWHRQGRLEVGPDVSQGRGSHSENHPEREDVLLRNRIREVLHQAPGNKGTVQDVLEELMTEAPYVTQNHVDLKKRVASVLTHPPYASTLTNQSRQNKRVEYGLHN